MTSGDKTMNEWLECNSERVCLNFCSFSFILETRICPICSLTQWMEKSIKMLYFIPTVVTANAWNFTLTSEPVGKPAHGKQNIGHWRVSWHSKE